MDGSVEVLLDLNPSAPDWIGRLDAFNQVHAGTMTFEDICSVEAKTKLINLLVEAVSTTTSSEVLKSSACALRILCRDAPGTKSATQESFIRRSWQLAGFNEDKGPFSIAARTEVAKSLVNILFKTEDLTKTFASEKFHVRLYNILKTEDIDRDLPPAYGFPLLRILFLILRPNDDQSSATRELADTGAIDTLLRILKHWTSFPQWPLSPDLPVAIREVLQVLFAVTVDMGILAKGPLLSYEKYLPNYEQDVTLLLNVFNTDPSPQSAKGTQIYEVKSSLLNCFMNIPVDFIRILVVLGDKEKTLETLFQILDIETSKPSGEGNLFPIFVVLKNLFAKAPEIRPIAMERMFPGRDLQAENTPVGDAEPQVKIDVPDRDKDTIGNRIIQMMTSFNQATQFTSNDLLFALVGEDTQDFIRLTGLGNAAGLLAMRGLFGMGNHLQRDTLSEFQEAQRAAEEAEAAQKAQDAIDAVPNMEDETRLTNPQQPRKKIKIPDFIPEREGETEEEKEDRMVRNFEKMVDAGLIKLVKKDENDPEEKK